MYESYWQLDEKPFETGCDPKYFYPGEFHQGALLKLRYAVESRRGGAMLAGASGLGKSLLALLLRSMLPEKASGSPRSCFRRCGVRGLRTWPTRSGRTEAVRGRPA